jgi:hypothetical protein
MMMPCDRSNVRSVAARQAAIKADIALFHRYMKKALAEFERNLTFRFGIMLAVWVIVILSAFAIEFGYLASLLD